MTEHSRPRVCRLSTTPIKGFALAHPEAVELVDSGAVGDRDFFLVDERGALTASPGLGAFMSWQVAWDRAAGRLAITAPGGDRWEDEVALGEPIQTDFWRKRVVRARIVDGPWSDVLSQAAGMSLRLALADEPGTASDLHPVTLLGDASVDELARRSGVERVDPRRFRMLIGLDGTAPHAEDEWEGRELRVGEALLRVGGGVPRCAATTRDPDSGERDLPVVRMIRDHRGRRTTEFGDAGVCFGVYATVLEPGRVRAGDPLELVG